MARDWVLGIDQAPFLPGAPGSQELEPEKTETRTSVKTWDEGM